MTESAWLVTVFKCNSLKAKDTLVDLYDFAKDLEEVINLHFIIRDRIEDEVIFSFRFMTKEENRKILSSKIKFKIEKLIPKESFVLDPTPDHPFYKYEAWPWKETVKERGLEKFELFCHFLSRLSEIVVEMAKQDYFTSEDRVEMVHVMSWMLGCTEEARIFSLKKINSLMVGYFDRINEKHQIYLQKDFPKVKS